MEGKLQNSIDIFNSRASEYQEKFMDISLYYDALDEFIKRLKPEVEVLELGCGPGNITQYVLQQHPGIKITGIDLAPNMLQLARKNCAEAEFLQMDIRKIATLKKKYDGVICGFCLPYLNKEETLALIKDISDILLPQGVLYLSTTEGKYEDSKVETNSHGEQLQMYYYESGYLATVLKENHFTRIQQYRVRYSRGNAQVVETMLVASK